MNRVLVLGAGLVAKPLVDTLLERPGLELTLAALDVDRARQLARFPRAQAMRLDVGDRAALSKAVADADVVVSLLPAPFHPQVAEAALEHRVHLVTTSYVSDQMTALDEAARERGVLLLNECGLDPGIDHMMAMEVIDQVRQRGGEITSFVSFCGGLPAPDSNDNPWGYKLSWTPRGVLTAARSPVRFRQGGETVEHPTPYLPNGPLQFDVPGVGRLEGYPNRDSLPYAGLYGIESAQDVLRGTLRYPGWCETMEALLRLGMLDVDHAPEGAATVAGLLARELPPGVEGAPLRDRFADFLQLPADHPVLDRFEWLGLFSGRPLPEDPEGPLAPLDVLARLFSEKLPYRPPEQDMVVLEHRFGTREADGTARRITERLVVFGQAGDESAMAQTVGVPAALACGLVLDDAVGATGVRIPILDTVAHPILAELRRRGFSIEMEEETVTGEGEPAS